MFSSVNLIILKIHADFLLWKSLLTEGDGIGMERCVLKKKSKTVEFTNIGKLQSEVVSLGSGFPQWQACWIFLESFSDLNMGLIIHRKGKHPTEGTCLSGLWYRVGFHQMCPVVV